MVERGLRHLARLTLQHPIGVLVAVAALSALFAWNASRLEMRTDLMDLVGTGTDASRMQQEAIRQLGYGDQFFVVIEAAGGTDADAERMEAAADRLVGEMRTGGYFKQVRAGMNEDELLEMVRLYAWHFPAFADPAAAARIAERLSDDGMRAHVRGAAAGLVTPFGPMAASYFAVDPLGVTEFLAPAVKETVGTTGFDMEWGNGGRFFSRDHRALLVIADPRQPASDYEFSMRLVEWTNARIAAILRRPEFSGGDLRVIPVGAQVYAEQSRRLIQENIRVASLISILGNLLLLVLVYRWLPAIVLTVVPTGLALLWTAGSIALYPGVVNLVSLAFVAILAGLGDDQVTYFFSRVPEESAKGVPVADAITKTYLTTGKSVLFCVLTTSTGTLALKLSGFRPLAELGLILTIGLLMLAVHTLVTVPALMALWWRFFPAPVSGPPFRFLPVVASRTGSLVDRHPRRVLAAAAIVLAAALAGLAGLQVKGSMDAFEGADALGVTGQRVLSERFGMEGAPTVFLLEGGQAAVLDRAERLERALRALPDAGIRSVVSPSSLVPSEPTQKARAAVVAGADLRRTAAALRSALRENGLVLDQFEPAIASIERWADGPLTVREARSHLPPGLLERSMAEVAPGRYLAAVTAYSRNPVATATLSPASLAALERAAGPVVEFSFDRVGRDLQQRIVADSRVALAGTLIGVTAIVIIGFRRLSPALLVLAPIAYGVVVTFGLLALGGHRFSGMAFFSIPLIIGIGIDNGIHLVRRYLEQDGAGVQPVLTASGPAVIQTNLTTVVGFGALMASSFQPLGEMGLITALGVGCTLVASLTLIPALLPKRARPSVAVGGDASVVHEAGERLEAAGVE